MDPHDAGTAPGTGDTGPGRGHAHAKGPAPSQGHPVAHALDGISDLLAGVAGVPLWTLDAADTAGMPLDLGRARRLFTPAQRRALILRDGGCAFPGSDRPASWCQGHHRVHWADGGPTDLDNAVLLCGHHHRLIHTSRWQVRIAADRLPEFTPPAYIDPQHTPRRNTRHHHRQAS